MSSPNTTSQALFGEFIGALVGMGKNLGLLTIALFIEAGAMVFHYLAVQSSLFLIGSEQKPLSADPVLGQWLGDFFGAANLSSFAAFVIVSVIAFGSYLMAEQVMELRRHREQRAAYRQELAYASAEDAETTAIAKRSIDTFSHKIKDAIELICVIGIPLVGVVLWDIYLAVYRGLAGAHGFSEGAPEAPRLATHAIQTLGLELEKHGSLFAWNAVPLMAVGLLCCMVLMPFAIEYCASRVASHGQRFAVSGSLLAGAAWRVIAGDYDGGSQVPAATPTANNAPRRATSAEPAPLFVPPIQEAIQEQHPVETETLKAVIGADARVSVAEAQRDRERYWVDPDTHEVWDAGYRWLLMGEMSVARDQHG